MEMSKSHKKTEGLTQPTDAVVRVKSRWEVWHLWVKKVSWFALAHLAAYFLTGSGFLFLASQMPAESRRALDFFTFYQSVSGLAILSQLMRGLIIGVLCLPLLKVMEKNTRPWLLLTGLVWGVGIFGSVEPIPGSFEGMLYTTTSAVEHLMALMASLAQVLLMVLILTKTGTVQKNQKNSDKEAAESPDEVRTHKHQTSYFKQFTLVHVATYFLVGMVFYQISGYEEALATMEAFSLWRPLENPVMPLAIFLGQFLRGFVLATLLFPYQKVFFQRRGGWKRLFITLWGMTFLAAVNIAPWVIQDVWLGENPLGELLIGPPEVTVQMLLFSILLYAWRSSLRRPRRVS